VHLAPAVTLDDLGPFVLGHHPLDLQPELLFRIVTQGVIQKDHLDPAALQFLQPENLIGVPAGPAVRRMHVQPIDHPQRRHVPQPLQGGTNEGRPAVARVRKQAFGVQFQPVLSPSFLPGLDLTGNGLRLGLLVRRNTGIQRGPRTGMNLYRAHTHSSRALGHLSSGS